MPPTGSGALTEPAAAKPHATRRRSHGGLTLGAVIVVVIGVFIIQNSGTTDLRYLWFDFRTPLWIGLLLSFSAGFVSGPLCVWGWRRQRRTGGRSRQR